MAEVPPSIGSDWTRWSTAITRMKSLCSKSGMKSSYLYMHTGSALSYSIWATRCITVARSKCISWLGRSFKGTLPPDHILSCGKLSITNFLISLFGDAVCILMASNLVGNPMCHDERRTLPPMHERGLAWILVSGSPTMREISKKCSRLFNDS